MKKKISILFGVIFALVFAFALTACGKVALKLTFKVDGEDYATISTSGNEVIKMPEDPTKDGYTFDGWFWDEGTWQRPFTANSLLDTPLSSDMSVYAKFGTVHVHEYSVENASPEYLASPATCTEKAKYYYSCSCGEKDTETFESGETSSEHPYDGTWSSNETYHFHKSTCIHGVVKDKEKHNFVAGRVCEVCEYLTSDPIGTEIKADGFALNSTVYFTKVSNLTETFSFIGKIKVADGAIWRVFTDVACTVEVPSRTKEISIGDNKFYILVTNGNDVNSYPFVVRRRPIYTVTYITNGGTEVASECVEEDNFATEPTTARIGYTFKAWDYDFSQPIVDNATISASWSPIVYNISYLLNGGTLVGDYPATYTIEDEVTLSATSAKDYYDFKGWSDGGKIEKGSIGDKTFTAEYTPTVYKITCDPNGGTLVGDYPATYTVEDEVTLSATALKDYYDFKGWSDGGKIGKGSHGDKVFTAEYTPTPYKIIYNLNGGKHQGNPETYTVEDSITLLNPQKDYYDFKEWSDGGKIEKGSHGDKTFTAEYTPIVYNIIYECGVGENAADNKKTYTIESETITLSDGYYINADFAGWEGDDGKQITQIPKGSHGDLTLTAIWNMYDVKIELATDGKYYYVIGKNTDKAEITIKSSYKGVPVTRIGSNAFKGCTGITNVTIGNGVTSIGDYAFSGCSRLTSIEIPDSVTLIRYWAFYECSRLTSVTIGNSVTSIGSWAFSGCSRLTSITVDENNSNYKSIDGNLYTKDGTTLIQYAIGKSETSFTIPNSVESIGYNAFMDCRSLTSITIPNSVTRIGDRAFYNCRSLTSVHISDIAAWCGIDFGDYNYYAYNLYLNNELVTELVIPTDITKIKSCAFRYCSSLTSVTIPNSVTSIGGSAFKYCDSLTSITIPDSVTSIGSSTFYNCSSLTSITVPNSVTSIGSSTFYNCRSLTSITIPNSVTSIGSSTFEDCRSLTSITIPNSVTSIGSSTFEDCRSLTSITIPNSVTSIGDRAFNGCSSLTSITIPNSVTSIGDRAFEYCSSLTSVHISSIASWCGIDFGGYDSNPLYHAHNLYLNNELVTELVIPTDITEIKDYAFIYCSSLTSITIPNSVTSIGSRAFSACSSLTSITIPNSVTSIGDYAFYYCYRLAEVYNLSKLNIVKNTTNNGYIGCYALDIYTDINTPSKLSEDNNGFVIHTADSGEKTLIGYCGSEKSITIPNSVTSIGDRAFENCSNLTSITIPNSVTSIGDSAFKYCDSLTSITIPDSVTSIGDRAFYNCSSLTSVTIGNSVMSIGREMFYCCSSLISITIPNSVTSIEYQAFCGCRSLTSITIPNSVTSIENYAFCSCSNLKTIYCEAESRPSGWDSDWKAYCNAKVIWGYKG